MGEMKSRGLGVKRFLHLKLEQEKGFAPGPIVGKERCASRRTGPSLLKEDEEDSRLSSAFAAASAAALCLLLPQWANSVSRHLNSARGEHTMHTTVSPLPIGISSILP